MNWISRSFNISNLISNRSQVLSYLDVLNRLRKINRKISALERIFNKVATIHLPFATLIKEETPAQVLSCEFWEIFKNIFFIKHLCVTPSVTLALLKYDFQFIVHFSPTVATYQIIYQTQWIWYCWRAPAKWSITVHLCSKK